MSFTVKWGRERLTFPLPPPETPLGAIRDALSEYTQIPAQSFKLIHGGAVMKDDKAPISAYHIHDGSALVLIGSLDPAPSAPRLHEKNVSTSKTEESTIKGIQDELKTVRARLLPCVDVFLASLSPSAGSRSEEQQQQHPSASIAPPNDYIPAATPAQEHTRLGELLLQSLLRLDAVSFDGSWEEARKERKEAVKEVQNLIDRLDAGWNASQA